MEVTIFCYMHYMTRLAQQVCIVIYILLFTPKEWGGSFIHSFNKYKWIPTPMYQWSRKRRNKQIRFYVAYNLMVT